MAKYAFLGDDPPGTALLELPIEEQVARCVALKVAVITEDEREAGRRADPQLRPHPRACLGGCRVRTGPPVGPEAR